MTVSSLAGMGQRGDGKASLRGKGKKNMEGEGGNCQDKSGLSCGSVFCDMGHRSLS